MLSILPPMLFRIKCLLRNTHQAHNVLYFACVEHTSTKSETPPLYYLSVIYYAYFTLLQCILHFPSYSHFPSVFYTSPMVYDSRCLLRNNR